MKLRNVFEFLGFRTKIKRYQYQIFDYNTEGGGALIRYAQWMHPNETKKTGFPDLAKLYQRYLNKGDFCIDIGAHTGDTTIPMAVAVGREGCVLALEPNPYVYHVLEKNARINTQVCNIRTILAAALEEEGFIEFEYSDSGFCNGGRHKGISVLKHGHPYKLKVFGINLKEELESDFSEYLPKLKLVKVDAEGYDLYILRSISSILKSYSPIIKAEVYKKTDLQYRRDFISFLVEDIAYRVYRLKSEPLEFGEELTKDNLCDYDHYDIICFPKKYQKE